MIGNFIGFPIGAPLSVSSELTIPATGTAAGTSTAVGYLQGRVLLTGLSQGTSTATAQSVTNEGTGNAAGNATVIGVGVAIHPTTGTAHGTSTAIAASGLTLIVDMIGISQGQSTVIGFSTTRYRAPVIPSIRPQGGIYGAIPSRGGKRIEIRATGGRV